MDLMTLYDALEYYSLNGNLIYLDDNFYLVCEEGIVDKDVLLSNEGVSFLKNGYDE